MVNNNYLKVPIGSNEYKFDEQRAKRGRPLSISSLAENLKATFQARMN